MDWQQEYTEFLTGPWEERQVKKQRIANAVAFLHKNTDSPLVRRIEFLLFKGLSQPELEEAFEIAGHLPELLRLLEGTFTKKDFSPTAEDLAREQAKQLKTLFREGDAVLSYVATVGAYFPAVVRRIDEGRGHDILLVEYTQDIGECEAGYQEWRAVGFKEVVADMAPNADHVKMGAPVLCVHDFHQGLFDALVGEVDRAVGVCSIEFATCEQLFNVPISALRTIVHPREAIAPSSEEEEVQTSSPHSSKASVPVSGAERFPQEGHRERAVQARELLALMRNESDARNVKSLLAEDDGDAEVEEDDLTAEERFTLGVSLQNFNRYAYLDVAQRRSRWRTFTDLRSDLPAAVFDLSGFPRHPQCPHLLQFNPILEIARQCRGLNAMFVDPDFPPTDDSLFGSEPPPPSPATSTSASSAPPDQFEWRRLTELFTYPKCLFGESRVNPLRPGPFTAKWMPPVFGAVSRGLDFETLFSPSQLTSYFGCYVVRLHVDGRFWYVLLDDFVPVYPNHEALACLRSNNRGEAWPCLLEKVYAKLSGSYQGLMTDDRIGPETAFEDLSCGLAYHTDYSLVSAPQTWLENMLGGHESRADTTMLLVVPTTTRVSSERKLQKLGIEVGGYHVVHRVVADEEGDPEETQFILSANACGSGCAAVEERAQLTVLGRCGPRLLRELQKVAEVLAASEGLAGVWLPFLEHLRLFEGCVTLCGFWGWRRALISGTFEGHAGSHRFDHANERWGDNPQVYLRILARTRFCAQLSLCDARFRKVGPAGKVLRMSLIRISASLTLATQNDPLVVTSDTLVMADAPAQQSLAVHLSAILDAGHYVIVPEMGSDSGAEPYVLKLWCPMDFTACLLN